jgi:hypothetical protein
LCFFEWSVESIDSTYARPHRQLPLRRGFSGFFLFIVSGKHRQSRMILLDTGMLLDVCVGQMCVRIYSNVRGSDYTPIHMCPFSCMLDAHDDLYKKRHLRK